MKSRIKVAAIHSYSVELPEEASPYSKGFDPAITRNYVNSNIDKMLEFLHEAGRDNVDLVCTHEDFKGLDHFLKYMDDPELFLSLVEEIPGPTSDKLGEIAKLYNMYIAANYYEREGCKIFNTSVLIGRDGKIAGKYRKVHLPPAETWRVTGGKEFSVFETDIGRIGFATCFDLYFPEHCRALALNGADIIIHQTQGWGVIEGSNGEALVRVRAAENCVYMVVAKNILGSGGKSCVINNFGDILAETEGRDEKILVTEFVPNFDMDDEYDFSSFFSGVSSMRARLALEREPLLYSAIENEIPPLLDRYKELKLLTDQDDINELCNIWRKHIEAIVENKPSILAKYHW